MSDTITLAQLKTRAKERANMEDSEFVSPSELLSYINTSYAELYDLLVASFENYYTTSTQSTVTGGSNSIDLPADFYKLAGIDYKTGSSWTTVGRWNFTNRNKSTNTRQYRILKNQVYLLPEERAEGTYRLWYTPRITRLVDDTDTIDAINGWEEHIIVNTAIKMLTKEESDVSALLVEKSGIERRIEVMAENRDSDPETITDVMSGVGDSSTHRWDY